MKNLTWVNGVLGVWLLIAAFIMGASTMPSPAAALNEIIVGLLLIVSSSFIVNSPTTPGSLGWFQALCGAWLLISPFVLGYRSMPTATGDDTIVGAIVIVMGVAESRRSLERPRPAA